VIYFLTLITFLNSTIAFAENIKIRKLKASYEFDDGLYEVRNESEGTILYLFKDGQNIVMHSMAEILHSKECRYENDGDFINNLRGPK